MTTTPTDAWHDVVIIPHEHGDYELRGFRSHDLTARFDLELDGISVLANADWPTMWTALHGILEGTQVEHAMRYVLPPVLYKEA